MSTFRTTLFSTALLVGLSASAMAQAPANDDCGNATAAMVGLNAVDATMATDSTDALTGACSVSSIFADVWLTFTAPTTDDYDIEIVDSGSGVYDTKLVMYDNTGCPADDLNAVACNDDNGNPGFVSGFTASLVGGQDYLIRVGSFGSSTTEVPVDLSIAVVVPPPATVNDECGNATVAIEGLNTVDATAATDSADALTGACSITSIFADVWMVFTAPNTADYDMQIVDAGNGTYDTKMMLYSATTCPADDANAIACNDDNGGLASGFTASLNAGQDYLIRVGSFGSSTTAQVVDLSIAEVIPPPMGNNDDCANATVAIEGLNAVDATAATDSADALTGACSVTSIFADVWMVFTAPNTADYDMEILDAGNGVYDTKMVLYSATTCPADDVNAIACNDDNGNPGFVSGFTASLTAGQDYLIRVGSYSGSTSEVAVDLSIAEVIPPPPANDDCANATAVGAGTFAFDTTLATTDGVALDPMVCDMGTFGDEQIHNDIWYCFTAPTTEDYTVTTFGLAGFDTRLAVYSDCASDAPANVIACNDDFDGSSPFEAGLFFSATTGSSYKVRLGGFSAGTVGAGDLLIGPANPPTAPANDDCANAAAIAPGLTAFDTALSTTDGVALDPMVCDMGTFGDEQIHNDVWYCFTAPNDKTYIVTTFGLAGFDTRLAVYDNGCGTDDPALVVACNDDFDGNSPFEAGLSFGATAGVSYKIRLGGFGAGTFGAGDLLIEEVPNVISFCFGDGLGRPCKCGNDDTLNPGTGGCLNSAATGAILTSNGDTSVSSNDLQFDVTGAVPTALAVLTSGDAALGGGIGILGLPESDGLRCVGQNFRRHGSRGLNAMGATGNAFGSNAGPVAGIIGQAGFVAGQTRFFQVRYREDPNIGPCGFGTNTSQALAVTFKP